MYNPSFVRKPVFGNVYLKAHRVNKIYYRYMYLEG